MSDYIQTKLTIPSAHKDAANRLAAIFDFDEGGINTFGPCMLSTDGMSPGTHYMCSTAIKPVYLAILTDPVQTMSALTSLAADRGRDLPIQADVDNFCANVIIGDPPGLVVVTDDPA